MRFLRSCRATAVTLACVTWLFPSTGWAAEEPTLAKPAVTPSNQAPPQTVQDITLGPGGSLTGQVVDPQGKPLPGHPLVVRQIGGAQLQATTDAQGRFTVQGLRGGVWQITSSQLTSVCRCWTARAAPPSANRELLVVSQLPAERGQKPISALTTPLLVGSVVVAAVVIPIVVHNSREDAPPGS